MKSKKNEKPPKTKEKGYLRVRVRFSLLIFVCILGAMLIMAGVAALLIYFKVYNEESSPLWLLFVVALVSAILGTLLTTLVIHFPFRSVRNAISTFNQLAAGDFSARIRLSRFLSRIPPVAELDRSFNIMAQELENTELLRSDFVNNFSHEFKTPIVSIAGFASLLRRGNLSEEQKQEYLSAIEEESMRLSAMATNVLNLSKVENQSILRDVTVYNLS